MMEVSRRKGTRGGGQEHEKSKTSDGRACSRRLRAVLKRKMEGTNQVYVHTVRAKHRTILDPFW